MADLNHIRTQLIGVMRPEEEGGTADLIGLFEEWVTWRSDEEVDLVSDTLEENPETRFLRLLIQYLAQIQTPRALARLHRLARHASPVISSEALRALEKIGSLSAQRLLLDWAIHDTHHRTEALASLTRCATTELAEDLQLALLTSLPDEVLLAILTLFKKLKAVQTVPSLMDVLKRSQNDRHIEQAIFSIAHLGRPRHLRLIRPYLKSATASVRRAVLFAMSRLGGSRGAENIIAHLSTEIDHRVRMEMLKDLKMSTQVTRRAFERLAMWAASAEEPGERYWASGLLGRWSDQNPKLLRKGFLQRALINPQPALGILLLHQAAFSRLLSSKRLAELACEHTDPSIRAAALDALGSSLQQLSQALPHNHRLENFLKDGSAEVRMTAAAMVARFAPKESLDGILEDMADPQTLRTFFFNMARQGRGNDLTPILIERLIILAQKGDRTTRALAITLLAASDHTQGIRALQAIATTEKESRLVAEAAWGILRYSSQWPYAFDDLFGPLLLTPRAFLALIKQVPRLEQSAPKARKALALRVGVFLSSRPILQENPLPPLAVRWMLFWRALSRDLENDVLDWFSIGTLQAENSIWLIRVLRSLLNHRTVRMDFPWLAARMDSPYRPMREQAAHLVAHHFPWTAEQTRHLVRWRLTEKDDRIRAIVDSHLRREALGFVEERRGTAR